MRAGRGILGVVLASVLVLGGCDEGSSPADLVEGHGIQLSLTSPAGVSEAEVGALAAAFDQVDRYQVTIVDAGSGSELVDTVLAVAPGLEEHVLDIEVPEAALGRSVSLTVVAFDGALELYRAVLEATLGGSGDVVPLGAEVRYSGPGVRGTITDGTGEGVGGVSVNLVQGQAIVAGASTEPDGTFLFLDVAPGTYQLAPSPPAGQAVCPGLQDVTVGSAEDAVVTDFDLVDGTCGTSVLVLSGGDFDETDSVAVVLQGDPDLSVSTFFFVNELPSPAFLGQFDAVLLFMNGLFDESTDLGTRVADYVAQGGNAVLASFYWQGRSDSGLGSTGWGALEDLDPFASVGDATYSAADLGTVVDHPLTANLASLSSPTGYRGGATAKSGTSVVASWDDGTPLIGYRVLGSGQRVVGVTLFPGCCAVGDVGALWQNAVNWAGSRQDPQQVDPPIWVDVAAGDAHTCGLLDDGSAYCWGSNNVGQLGRPDIPEGATPRLATAAHRFVSIEAGGRTTCGLTAGGTAYCWGSNTVGQAGSGSTSSITNGPEEVPGGPWTRIEMGVNHSCALDGAGAAYCWGGGNASLALGFQAPEQCGSAQVPLECSRTPRPVETTVRFADLGPGLAATCGVALDGIVHCWGNEVWGQLGIGPYVDGDGGFQPRPVASATTFSAVDGGVVHMCGVSTADEAYCWGGTTSDGQTLTSGFDMGQVGQGGTPGSSPPAGVPSPVVGGLSFTTVSTGEANSIYSMFTCALTPAGEAHCWGASNEGELGQATPPPVCDRISFGPAPCTTSPLPVQGGHTFVELDSGLSAICGLTDDGRILCWGANGSGQRGDPDLTSTSVPTEVPVPGNMGG